MTSLLGINDLSPAEAALAYAAMGLSVLPVWWTDDTGACACGSAECRPRGKHPIGPVAPRGSHSATTDPATLRGWWERYPRANVALHPGEGAVVVDVDPKDGGDATLTPFEPLPATPMQRTPSGGRHYLFRQRTPGELPNGVGKARKGGPVGLDTRTHGGIFVVSPSVIAGRRYRWEQEAVPAVIPDALADALLPPVREATAAPGEGAPSAAAGLDILRQAVRDASEIERRTGPGEDGRKIVQGAAHTLGRLLAGHGLLVELGPIVARTLLDACGDAAERWGAERLIVDTLAAGAGKPLVVETEPAVGWPEPIDIARALSTEPPAVPALLRHPDGGVYLPADVVGVIAAPGGSGKTGAVIELAIALAAGRNWLGPYGYRPEGPRRVLALLGETSPARLHERVSRIAGYMGVGAADLGDRCALIPMARVGDLALLETDRRSGRTAPVDRTVDLVRSMLARHDPDLLILDPLTAFASPETEVDNCAATRFVALLDQLAVRDDGTTRAVLLVHHTSQSGAKAKGDDDPGGAWVVRGVTGLVNRARWVVTCMATGEAGIRQLRVSKANDCRETSTTVRVVDGRWTVESDFDRARRGGGDVAAAAAKGTRGRVPVVAE